MLHEELDLCHGSCVLRHADARKEVTDALTHFDGSRLWLGDFVVMPNHVHAIIQPLEDWELEDVLASIKRWSSRQIGQRLNAQPAWIRPSGPEHKRARFWQQESYDRIIRDEEELAAFRRYIANNPAAAHLKVADVTYFVADWLDEYAQRPTL